jgi:hypothetical protein
MSAGGFRTPKTTVWRSVTAKASVNNGHCKAIECNNCEATFAGGAARILEHILKCEGAPGSLSVWATEQLASREESRKTKEECKKLAKRQHPNVYNEVAMERRILTQRRLPCHVNLIRCYHAMQGELGPAL